MKKPLHMQGRTIYSCGLWKVGACKFLEILASGLIVSSRGFNFIGKRSNVDLDAFNDDDRMPLLPTLVEADALVT